MKRNLEGILGNCSEFEVGGEMLYGSPEIFPRNDRVLIRRIEQQGPIILTDAEKSKIGTVLAIGPGKWHPGDWRYIKKQWIWMEGWREPSQLKAGDTVLFSSKWNDLARDYYDDLPVGADPLIHLVQEGDILAKLNA